MTDPDHNLRVVLASRPVGAPRPENFRLERAPLPVPAEGQFVVRNRWLGLAPAARIRMGEGKSYAPPTPLGEPVYGQSLGEVVASRHPGFREGDAVVLTDGGWQMLTLSDGARAVKIAPGLAPETAWLGPLGGSGMTA